MNSFLESFLALIFPPICLHCHAGVEKSGHLFCALCEKALENDGGIEEIKEGLSMASSPFFKLYVLYDYHGPAGSLVRELKYGQQLYLAKTIAAMIALEFHKQSLEIPDYIVPVPITFFKCLSRGFNQTERIAHYLSKIWGIPVKKSLKRSLKGKSQAGLSKLQREALSVHEFSLVQDLDLQGKDLLLLDDVMTTGSTLHKCAETLLAARPRVINGLSFCYSI